MKLISSLLPAFWAILIAQANLADAAELAAASSDLTALREAFQRLPAREVVLDLHHDSLEYGARRDAGEFLNSVLNVLLSANYNVRLSDAFMLNEIKYYRDNLSQELPPEMSRGILSCLEKAQSCGTLDWSCFNGDFNRSADPSLFDRHLPWLAPPFKAKAVTLAGSNATNLLCLQLSLKWAGRAYGGAVQHARRPGGLAGETVLTEGHASLWAFAGHMRLEKAGQVLFEKEYPRPEWQNSYSTVYDRPLWKTSQAMLQDLTSGVKAGPAPDNQNHSGKRSKHS